MKNKVEIGQIRQFGSASYTVTKKIKEDHWEITWMKAGTVDKYESHQLISDPIVNYMQSPLWKKLEGIK